MIDYGALHTQSLISHLACWIAGEEITFMMLQLSNLFIPRSPQFCLSRVQQFFPSISCNFSLCFSLVLQAGVDPGCNIFLV